MIITSLDLLAAVLITWLWGEVNLHHCNWALLSHVQLFVHEEHRPFSAKKSNSLQPVFLPCSSSVPGAEKLHLAYEASVSSFLQHLKIPLNNGSAPQHIGHCSIGMLSIGWQRKPPGLFFVLLIEALNSTDPSINPSFKSDGESAEHYSLNQASLSPKLLFTGLVQISAIWLPGRMMKWGWGKSCSWNLSWLYSGYCSWAWSTLTESVLAIPGNFLGFWVSENGFQVNL